MALLRKLRAASLLETLIASVIVLIAFAIGSLSFNNAFKSVVKNNRSPFENRVRELKYQAKYNTIEIPFYEETHVWEIAIEKRESKLLLQAVYLPTEKQIIKILDVED